MRGTRAHGHWGTGLAVALAVPLCLCAPVPALAQCPDGSPPPCRAGVRPAGPALALNDQTWLVLPFENQSRAADAELIRQASVSQLYAEMSRWSGIRVVPDARVADLLQSLPAESRERLGLESARGLARRVGAGRVVIGGYLAAGGRANITATVYDTRSGRELRVVRDPLAGYTSEAALDSLATSFGRLARGILNLPETRRGQRGGIGTQSLEAYRAYVAGMDAFNRFDLEPAIQHFNRAVAADSNFAMARLMRFRLATDTVAGRADLMAAVRQAERLPERERTIVESLHAVIRGDRRGACTAAHRLVELDSSDAEGWSGLTSCYLNATLTTDGGTVRITGDLNLALRSAERAYALAPDMLPAQISLLNALVVGSTMQCVVRAVACPPESYYRVSLVPSGDSIAVLINHWHEVRHAPPDLAPAACAAQQARYERASRLAERIAGRANSYLLYRVAIQYALATGDTTRARDMLDRGTISFVDTSQLQRRVALQSRFDLALARGRDADLQLYAESLFALRNPPSQYLSMMGRLHEGGSDTTEGGRQNARWRRILVGVLEPGFDSLERAIAERLTGTQREDFLQLTTLAGFYLRRTGPALDTAARHPVKRFQAWFASGNVARARTALSEFDRELTARHLSTPDDGGWLFSAEAHLLLGDSGAAWQRMQEFGRRWHASIAGAYILEARFWQSTTPRLWGRAWLLYGDLAAARRQPADARRAYRMVMTLWERGDDVVQPFVARARSALQQLGG